MGEVIRGILIPFLGTTLGASCVLFMKKMMNKMVQRNRICGRDYGFRVCVELAYTVNGLCGGNGEVCICTGGCGILDRYIVFAGNGPYNTAFAYGYR